MVESVTSYVNVNKLKAPLIYNYSRIRFCWQWCK